jgi:hypothetical protein
VVVAANGRMLAQKIDLETMERDVLTTANRNHIVTDAELRR